MIPPPLETVSQFVIPAKSRKAGREPGSRNSLIILNLYWIPDLVRLSPNIPCFGCSDRGYDRPSGCPRASNPATYGSSTSRIRIPAVARWHAHLHGLATQNHETSGLADSSGMTGSVNCDIVSKGRRDSCGGRLIGAFRNPQSAIRNHRALCLLFY